MDLCTTDDPTEPANDGPAGAVALGLDGSGDATATAEICSQPRTEADYYAFQVTTIGDVSDLSLAWTGTRDLDLELYNAAGDNIGLSYWEHPEAMRVTYLPLGTYYIRISEFSSPTTTSLGYTLSVHRAAGAGCTSRSDAPPSTRNQVYRGDCVAGACTPIDGMGAVPQGGACDSVSDCGAGLSCPSFYFIQDASTRDYVLALVQ